MRILVDTNVFETASWRTVIAANGLTSAGVCWESPLRRIYHRTKWKCLRKFQTDHASQRRVRHVDGKALSSSRSFPRPGTFNGAPTS